MTAVWYSETSSFLKNEPARFILACHRSGSLVGSFVWPGAYIVGDLLKTITDDDNNLPVDYLLDGVSYTDWWRTSGDESVLIPPDVVPVFLNQVSSANILGIQVLDTDLFENGQQARYEVLGLAWALKQLPCTVQSPPALSPTPTQRSGQPTPTPTAKRTPTSTPTPRPTATPRPTPTLVPSGDWETFTYEDNLTGQSHTGVSLDAVWSTGAFSRVEEDPAQFVLKCDQDSGLDGYFKWPGTTFLFGDPFKDNKLPVEYVIDDVRHTGWWAVADDKSAIIAPEDLQVFLGRVSSAGVLGIQFLETEWFDNEAKARFEVPGITWALEQLPCSVMPLMSTLAQAKLSLVRVEVHDAAGSGVVIGMNQGHSLVLTAWHVVESFCDEAGSECVGVSVVVGGERYHGSLRSFNRQEDLAVLDVEGVLPVAKLASGVPQIGTDVVTIGLPEGEHDFQYNEGRIVRHSGCSFESCLATNARAWSGFSGGALINLDGEIVGVISEGWTGSYYSNAVSVDAIQALLES